MKRSSILILAAAFVLACTGAAMAGIIPAGQQVVLEDNDWEIAITGGDATLDVGDLLIAMFEIQAVKDMFNNTLVTYTPSTRAVTGVTVLEVAGRKVSGNLAYWVFKPYAGDWSDLGLGLNDANDPNTMLVAYDDPVSSPFNHVVPTSATFPAAFATAQEGTLLYELGYASGWDGVAEWPNDAPDELWTALSIDLAAVPDPTDITKIDTLQFSAALNLTYKPASSAPLAKITGDIFDFFTPVDDPIEVTSDLIIRGTRDELQDEGIFALSTDCDVTLHIVPEPASLVIWALIGATCLGASFLRRRRR